MIKPQQGLMGSEDPGTYRRRARYLPSGCPKWVTSSRCTGKTKGSGARAMGGRETSTVFPAAHRPAKTPVQRGTGSQPYGSQPPTLHSSWSPLAPDQPAWPCSTHQSAWSGPGGVPVGIDNVLNRAHQVLVRLLCSPGYTFPIDTAHDRKI